MAVVSNCLNLTKNEFTWCGFTNFASKFQQVRIISVSCDCKPFIFKICQTVAGPSFNRFLKSDFDWFLPFGPPNCVTSIKFWRVKNLHSLLKIPLTMIRLCTLGVSPSLVFEKATVFGVIEDLTFKISEDSGQLQFWSEPSEILNIRSSSTLETVAFLIPSEMPLGFQSQVG